VPWDPKDRAFYSDPDHFKPKTPPKPGDWMERFSETGLTFDEYVASRPTERNASRNTLIIQPLGTFSKDDRNTLDLLSQFTSAFFDTQVRLAPSLVPPRQGQRERQAYGRHFRQHHTGTILRWLASQHLPSTAVAVLAVTLDDLYPEPSWNYVFGEATLEKRVGVYSLARYGASFWGKKDTEETKREALKRSLKVLAHETAHMFSLVHCRRYECLMNGSNSLEEMDRAPLEPCAVCLKMLNYNLRFDIPSRYLRLMAFYESNRFQEERDWIQARLRRIGCGNKGT
jgi:archaemetzincin